MTKAMAVATTAIRKALISVDVDVRFMDDCSSFSNLHMTDRSSFPLRMLIDRASQSAERANEFCPIQGRRASPCSRDCDNWYYTDSVSQIDRSIFHWINHWSDSYAGPFVFIGTIERNRAVAILLVLVFVLCVRAGPRPRRVALMSFGAVVVALVLCFSVKLALNLPRPMDSLGTSDVILRIARPTSGGAASSHATIIGAAIVISRYYGWYGLPFVAVSLLVGVARIYVGVHFPSQVILGFCLGVVSAMLVISFAEGRFFAESTSISERFEKETPGDVPPSISGGSS